MYEQQIAEQARALPIEKQREVLDFVEFLRSRVVPVKRPSAEGALEHLNIHFSERDLDELRAEMWGKFSRDLTV